MAIDAQRTTSSNVKVPRICVVSIGDILERASTIVPRIAATTCYGVAIGIRLHGEGRCAMPDRVRPPTIVIVTPPDAVTAGIAPPLVAREDRAAPISAAVSTLVVATVLARVPSLNFAAGRRASVGRPLATGCRRRAEVVAASLAPPAALLASVLLVAGLHGRPSRPSSVRRRRPLFGRDRIAAMSARPPPAPPRLAIDPRGVRRRRRTGPPPRRGR